MIRVLTTSISMSFRLVITIFVYFRIVADNVDFTVHARHQTKASQNKSLHWTHAFAVKNRVNPDSSLHYDKPQMQCKSQILKCATFYHQKVIKRRSAVIWSHLFTGKLLNLCPVMLLSSLVYSTIFCIHILRKCQKNQIRYC